MTTAYYLCHGLWTVIPHQLEENFRDMRGCGFDAVALTFSESEMVYSRRAFELHVDLAQQSFFHEAPHWTKYRLESVRERTCAECRAAGKKTYALVENMLMPASAIPDYERNLDAYLQGPLPDHLALYYYAHNNEDPKRVHAITRRLMQQHLR